MIRHHLELEERQPDRPPPRRLALVPPPADGEAFHSWFFRLVEVQHSHRDTVASLLGLPPYTPQRYTLGEDFLTVFDGEYVFENLRDATGLRARAMMRMALMSQGGQFITYSWTGTTSTRPWPWRADTAAVCPRCLAGPDPIWRIAWHLLPCVVCPIHRVYLTGWCPSCHSRISVGDTPRYRRECNGPFGPQGRIVGARNCRQQLARLPCEPVGSERLLRIQQDLLAQLHRPRDGPIEPTKAFWDLYELLFRLAIYFGTPEMLPADTDAHLWWTFHEFCHLRDQLALTAGPTARERCGDLLSYQPGPLLSAAAMLIIDELSFTGTLLDALRYFMDQRRYDPWAGTLWHEFCDDYHPTAVTNRILNHLKIRTVDPALLKPLALWEPGAPHHLHPAETVDDLDLPEAALLLAGEGLRPWESSVPDVTPHKGAQAIGNVSS
ncbi:TniQ family protein [Nonomuraea sp. NPDC050786]|uniref:TniQ family protein n=1 Tax=Nonomuraea sp. NPDC050786 TaxID=3154840 RepID=UPI0033C46F92